MSADQLAARLLSEASRISGDKIRRGDISQRDFDRFVEVSREMATLPLVIDDTPAITISALRTRCRRLKRTRGLESSWWTIFSSCARRPAPGRTAGCWRFP